MKLNHTTGAIRLSAKERSELMTLRNISSSYTTAGIIATDSYTIRLGRDEVVEYLEAMGLNFTYGYQQYWNHTPETLASFGDDTIITIVVREFNNSALSAPLMNAVIIGA